MAGATVPAMAMAVLYDADCGVCRRTMGWLTARDPDGRLAPVAMQSPEGERLLAGMPRAQRLRSAHVVTAGGTVRSGGDAVAPILAELGHPRWARVARALGPLLRVGYRVVADHRSLLGRLGSR
jgi:predicted DCC family thiol-disulfide oxidoreductase YuxK